MMVRGGAITVMAVAYMLQTTLAATDCHRQGFKLVCRGLATTDDDILIQNIDNSNITELDLSYNQITNLTILNYPSAVGLRNIDLSHNSIQYISEKAFMSTKLSKVDLSFNSLSPSSFPEGSVFHSFADVEILNLNLAFNPIRNLTASLFHKGLPDLEILSLSGCGISTIHQDAFFYLLDIRSIDLSRNRLVTLEPKWFTLNTRLQFLDFSHNGVKTILQSVNNTNLFPRLITMNVSHNLIERLFDGTFNYSTDLNELDLSHNELTTVNKISLPWNQIEILKLDGNPWKCDCRLKWLTKKEDSTMTKHKITCDSPSHLEGQNAFDLDTEELCRRSTIGIVIGSVSAIIVAAILIGAVAVARKKGCRFSNFVRGEAAYSVIYNEDPDKPVTKICLADSNKILKEAEDV